MDFAVWHEGIEEGQGRWVLAVVGERVLLSGDDGSFYWKLLADCKLVRIHTPDTGQVVIPVQPQPQALALPGQLGAGLQRNGHR